MALWSLFLFLTTGCTFDDVRQGMSGKDAVAVALTEIEQMDSCRLRGNNRDFYLHKHAAEKALTHLTRRAITSDSTARRITRAKCRYAFATTDYLLQMGKAAEANAVMDSLASDYTLNLQSDTTLWLEFLCHEGMAAYRPYQVETHKETIKKGFDCLIQGYILANKADYQHHKALSLLLLSKYMQNDSVRHLLVHYDRAAIRYVNENGVEEQFLPMDMAERAVNILLYLDDIYLTTDALRNLALCYFNASQYEKSSFYLNLALANTETTAMADVRTHVLEQMSMTYAALSDKHLSDVYRNKYLDIQDSTRQDRQLEARIITVRESTERIWSLVVSAIVIFLFLCCVTVLLWYRSRRYRSTVLTTDAMEQQEEKLRTWQLKVSDMQRATVEQRARVQMVSGMVPLIDRMRLAAYRGNMDYARELAVEIERQNDMLTRWIKLRKGIVKPIVEPVALNEIMDIVRKRASLMRKDGIRLHVDTTDSVVRADAMLTLFIVNTLVDNARNALTDRGEINITCGKATDNTFAEICVEDNGTGMAPDTVAHLFDIKPVHEEDRNHSHGFGLLNCRGIIERYKKISSSFSVCDIRVESVLGRGTKVFVRLPLVLKSIILLLATFTSLSAHAAPVDLSAARLCDSLYKCNVEGRYAEGMVYADSCYAEVKRHPETDVEIRLSLYNETAVAALSLHQWDKYKYFNYLYTNLYKDVTRDTTLPTYYETLERNQLTANVTMLIMLIVIAMFLPAIWLVYLRYRLRSYKTERDSMQQMASDIAMLQNNYNRLHVANNITDNLLSTLKHETMYYPARIRQSIDTEEDADDIVQQVDFYGELYNKIGIQAINATIKTYTFPLQCIPLASLLGKADGGDDDKELTEKQVIANEELLHYLQLLLKRQNNGHAPAAHLAHQHPDYAVISYRLEASTVMPEQIETLFQAGSCHADFLVMKQIMREIGNAAQRYGTGIAAEYIDGTVTVNITLPVID